MKKLLIILLTSCLLLGCRELPETNDEGKETVTESISYLALGDSYTIGEGVDREERWPVQLVDRLQQEGINIEEPVFVAQTGWTTGDLLQAISNRLGKEQYDLVSVSIGVNNQYQGRSIAQYEQELRRVLLKAIKHSKKGAQGVFAVSIPDYGVTPFGAEEADRIQAEIRVFNKVFEETAEALGIDFYNITPASRTAQGHADLLASDKLHPSGKQYNLWVEVFSGAVASKLEDL